MVDCTGNRSHNKGCGIMPVRCQNLGDFQMQPVTATAIQATEQINNGIPSIIPHGSAAAVITCKQFSTVWAYCPLMIVYDLQPVRAGLFPIPFCNDHAIKGKERASEGLCSCGYPFYLKYRSPPFSAL